MAERKFIERKSIFVVSLFLFVAMIVLIRSGVLDTTTGIIAVNQLSDDPVVSSVAREMARGNSLDFYATLLMFVAVAGVILSFIPKKKKKEIQAEEQDIH